MAIIGSAFVEIRGKDTFFEKDIRDAVKKIKDVVINVKADTDLSDVRKKVAALKADQRRRPLKLQADIDLTLVKAKLKSLHARHVKDIEFKVKASTADASKSIESLRNKTDNNLKVTVDADTEKASRTVREFTENFTNSIATITAEAETVSARSELIDVSRERTASIRAQARTAGAEAQMAFAARNRTSFLRLNIDKDTIAGIKGLAYAITGALPMEKIKKSLTGIASEFEMITLKALKILTLVGSVGAAGSTAIANMLAIAGGATKVVGLLAFLPALLGSTGIAVTALALGFKDFFGALTGDEKALAKLPIDARNAVAALSGLGSELRVASQTRFWEALEGSLENMVTTVFPAFKKGMVGASGAMGGYFKEYFDVLSGVNNDGGLDTFFARTIEGFDNSVRGIRPFNEALGILALTGSEFLPRFGTWMSDLGVSFHKWISEAEKAGDITRWIEEAIDASQDLGDATVGLARIFKGLTTAAVESGAKGLHEFAQGLLSVAEVVQGEPFQSRLTEFLIGAREGTDFLGAAFGRLSAFIGESASAWAAFFSITGQIGGQFIDGIKTMFDGTGLGAGLYAAFAGARTGLSEMEPAFRDTGRLIGDLGEIAGEMFVHMAPGFNNLMRTISGAVDGMKQGILDAMPAFNEFIQNFVNLASGPIIAIATSFGDMLTSFSKIDPILQTLILSLLTFLLLKKRLVGFFDPLKRSTEATRREAEKLGRTGITMGDRIASGWKTARTSVGEVSRGLGLFGTSLRESAGWVKYYSAGVPASFREVASETAKAFGNVNQSIRRNVAAAAFYAEKRIGDMKAPIRAVGANIGAFFRGMGASIMKDGGLDSVVKGFAGLRDKAIANFRTIADSAKNTATKVGTTFRNSTTAVGNYFKEMPGAFRTGMSGMVDTAHLAAGGIKNAFQGMKTTVSQGFRGMADVARLNLGQIKTTFSQSVIGPIVKGFNAIPAGIRGPIVTTGKIISTLGAIGNAAGILAGRGIASGITAGTRMVATEATALGRAFTAGMAPIATGIGQTFRGMGQDASGLASKVGTAVAGAAKVATSAVSSSVVNAATRVSTGVSSAVRVSTGLIGSYASSVARTVSSISQSISTGMAATAAHFRPVVTAAGNLGANLMGGFGGGLRSMGDFRAAAELTAGAIGTGAKKGIVGAVSGLTGALGGPWGIAIMGAIAALGLLGQANAKEKAKVDALTASLDKQSGALTEQSRRLIAEDWMDMGRTKMDDFVRGIGGVGKGGAHNSQEIAKLLRVDPKDVTSAISNEKTRGAYTGAWKQIADSTKGAQLGFGKGRKDLDSLADSVFTLAGTTRSAVADMSNVDLQEFFKQVSEAGEAANKAQQKIRDLAAATGTSTVQAERLSANYDVLAASTSSVSDMLSALKSNLDILNQSKATAFERDKNMAQSADNTRAALETLRTEVDAGTGKEYKIDLSQFVAAKGEFQTTSQKARDFHTEMSTAADSILTTALTSFKLARDGGAEMGVATTAAVSAIQAPMEQLKAQLWETGSFTDDQITGILDQLGLVDNKVVTAMIKADGTEAVNEALRVQLLVAGITAKDWTLVLNALPDDAKAAIAEAYGTAEEFKTGVFTATIDALNKTEGGVGAALTDLSLVVGDKAKYVAEINARNGVTDVAAAAKAELEGIDPRAVDITALDLTSVGVLAARSSVESINPVFAPIFAENHTAPAVDAADSYMNSLLSKKRSALIEAKDGTGPVVAATRSFLDNFINAPRVSGLQAADKTQPGTSAANASMAAVISAPRTAIIGARADSIAVSEVSSVLDNIAFRGRTAFIDIAYRDPGMPSRGRTTVDANGSVRDGAGNGIGGFNPQYLKFFANGGVENHVAQITKPNSPMRIWSEKETGGEAYIPLNPAKRGRSMGILEEVARIFGVGIVKKFADGGVDGSPSAGRLSSDFMVNLTNAIIAKSGKLTNIGMNIADGIVVGIDSNVGKTNQAAKTLSDSLVGTVRSTLKIQSPSKVFLGLGKNIVDGLTVGIKTTGDQASKAMLALANKLYVQTSDVFKATGQWTHWSTKLVEAQAGLSGWFDKSRTGPDKYSDQIATYYRKHGNTDAFTLRDVVTARENFTTRLTAANKKLADMRKVSQDLASSTSSSVRGEYKLGTGILSNQNAYTPELEFNDVKSYTANVANKLRSFNEKIKKLAKKGVAPALIAEVASLGSAEGGAVADALLQGSSADISSLNKSYASIGSLSNSVGKSTADAMYKVGIDAQAGLVNGLTKNASAMTNAANKMTSQLIAQVKKNLGIHSPSRVFMEIGGFVSQGMIDGLDALQPEVNARIDSLVNPNPRTVNLSGSASTDQADGRISSNRNASAPVVNLTVNPSQGLNEAQIGEAAWSTAYWHLQNRTN